VAKGKGGSKSSGGPHKKHGPKKKMFHCWDSTTRLHLAKAGLLRKYNNKESFEQCITAKGVRNNTDDLWNEFIKLNEIDKKTWFKQIKK